MLSFCKITYNTYNNLKLSILQRLVKVKIQMFNAQC